MPMGFTATDDEFCRRDDVALQGVTKCVNVVDILLYNDDLQAYPHRVNAVLQRCRSHEVNLKAEMFNLATTLARFCRFMLSAGGIAADHENVRTFFYYPTLLTGDHLWDMSTSRQSFFQISQQQPLRPLMSFRRSFMGTLVHEAAFQRVKKV